MTKKSTTLIFLLIIFCFVKDVSGSSVIELLHTKYYDKKYLDVKTELLSLNKKELTLPQGIPTPDGGHYNLHKFMWNSKGGVDCILLLFVVPDFDVVNDVGFSGSSYKIVDDPDNSIRDRRQIEYETVCNAGK